MNPWKPKRLCKPAQNFVECSHLDLPPFLSPQNWTPFLCPQNWTRPWSTLCFELYVGRASTFIICHPTKCSLCFAYLRSQTGETQLFASENRQNANICERKYRWKTTTSKSKFINVKDIVSCPVANFLIYPYSYLASIIVSYLDILI